MNKPLVSILIPVFNRESYIKETVESAINQSYNNIEIIIVDNASTDNTWSIIDSLAKTDHRIKTFRNKENIGPVKNWKRCIEESSGKYGKILWSDDLMASTFIEKSVSLIENDEIGFVYSDATIIDQHGLTISKPNTTNETQKKETYYFINETLTGNKTLPVSPGCALFRTSDLRKNLIVDIPNSIGADTSMIAIGNDLLLFLLTCKDYKYYYHITEPLNSFRAHDGSITISSEKGKIPAFYTMATAYFITLFNGIDKRTLYKFNARIYIQWRRRKQKRFGFTSWKSFYPAPIKYNHFTLGLYILAHKLKKKVQKF